MLALAILSGVETACAREYRILAIRVDFPYENPDHETTTGRGTFDLRDYYSDPEVQSQYYHPWDIPPHDKRYFSNHLQALNTYWNTVSEGRVSMQYRILPEDPRLAYTMSRTFYKYGNGRTTEQTNQKLVELFREAMETCKQKEGASVSFADYDTFMIIHAGMGKETSAVLNDIPSAYLSETDFKTYLGGPLMIDGVPIDNGMIVPEMTSESGLIGLNGIFAQMFGHRLGLPSLSNNKDGLPAAGGWALMDTGAMAYGYGTRGFIPTYPCIWSKIALGWETPVVATSDTTIDIAATHLSSTLPHGIKIPITADEYLLIENRERYASRDSLPAATFSDTDSSGVWMKVNNYDAYIPGSGILIWRINERIIRENRASDAVNNDSYRRGVDLLEADGLQDIGAPFSFGDARADYSEGYEGDTYKQGGQRTLSPTTEPNSGSLWGGNSGITVTVNSVPGDIMNVTVTFAPKAYSFPISAPKAFTSADLNGDGAGEMIVSVKDSLKVVDTGSGRIMTAPAAGHPAVMHDASGQTFLASPLGDTVVFYTFNGSSLDQAAVIPLKTQDGSLFNAEGSILKTDISSTEHLLLPVRSVSGNESYILDMAVGVLPTVSVSLISLPDTTRIHALASAGDYIAALSDDNTLSYGNVGENSLARHTFPSGRSTGLLLADLDRNGEYETITVIGKNLYILRKDGSLKTVSLPDEPVGEPVAADIDLDGYPEILQSTESRLCAFRSGGIPVDGFPRRLPPGDPEEKITSQPVFCDLDRDGYPDIAYTTSDMRIVSHNASGKETSGFPVTMKGNVSGSPLVYRTGSTGVAGLAYCIEEGFLCTRNLSVTIQDNDSAWVMWRGGAGLSASLLNGDIPSSVKTTAKFEAYCYPNPIVGGTGTFRITPEGNTYCTVVVYSADGRKVYECRLAENQVIPGAPNEITMNTSKLASGLYIAKISTRTRTLIYKVGVIK